MKIDPIYTNSIQKTSKTLLHSAYTLLAVGFIIGIYLITDYNFGYRDITYKMKFSDLGTMLSGSVGLLWSLAGIFFFIYNLQQQKETLALQREDLNLQREELALQRQELANQVNEMKTANKTAAIQQKAIEEQTLNSLLNSLLQNNRKLVDLIDIKKLKTEQEQLEIILKNYSNNLKIKTFYEPTETHNSPLFYISIRNLEFRNILHTYFYNILDIIVFIDTELKNRAEFYHRMFFNQLSYSEKYLIGFCLKNEVFSEKINLSFNYMQTFENSQFNFTYTEGFFPVLEINIFDNILSKSEINFNGANHCGYVYVSIWEDYGQQLNLKKVTSHFEDLSPNANKDKYALTIEEIFDDKKIKDGENIDIYYFVRTATIDKINYNLKYLLHLHFSFEYNNQIFEVWQKHPIKFSAKSL